MDESSDVDWLELESDADAVFDFFIQKPVRLTQARKAIQNAFEKQALLQEVDDLRNHAEKIATTNTATNGGVPPPTTSVSDLTPLLTVMARTLSTSFDLDRLMNHFLETVAEMLRPNRVSLAIFDSELREYRIKAHRGLNLRLPQLAPISNLDRRTSVGGLLMGRLLLQRPSAI